MHAIHRRIVSLATVFALGIGVAQSRDNAAEDYVLQEFMTHCMTDMAQYCSTEEPGGGRFVRCLQANSDSITTQCKDAVKPTDGPAGTASVEVTVSGVNSDVGVLMVMLTDDPAKFPSGRRLIFTTAKSGTFVGSFKNLRPGTYAITAFHDSNGNNLFDRAAAPLEGFASINSSAEPPSFANSAMPIGGHAKLTLTLKYY
jgi:uncharacterized protein (DUF2141 family)